MQTIQVNATLRTEKGKRSCRQMRQGGKVPAVFYGPQRTTIALTIDAKEFGSKVMSQEGSHLIRFASEDSDLNGKVALVKDSQVHALTGVISHADFLEVDMTVRLRVPVPLHFVGKPVGVVNGGVLQPIRREVVVECLPSAIPEYIEVDVTHLGIHDSVHVKQLVLPDGVEVPSETDFTVVSVAAPIAADAKGETAAAPGAPAAVAPAPAAAKAGEAKH